MTSKTCKQKIIVGLSGGVDSAVSALLLKQQGYDVEGLFMKNWQGDDNDDHCSAETDLADASAVCSKLEIPLHSVNFSAEYWDNVFEHFLNEHHKGRTPNPDILCNKEIKFKAFLDHALALGADKIATGHYVQIEQHGDQFQLRKGADRNKDQSYFLYTLQQDQLAKSCFPVGHLPKPEVRKLAEDAGLVNHNKKDSTGICFIGERKFKNFLNEYMLAKPGEMVSTTGEPLGPHDGLMFYTLGQRQGLQIGGRAGSDGSPWYVVDKDMKNNQLIVAQGKNHPRLFSRGLICDDLHWVSGSAPEMPYTCYAKTRYRQWDQACQLTALDNDDLCVMFSDPQRAVTPGQSVVFYDGNICLGGGVIREAIS
jgi:tRNA-uridine 2-sulfurtransferase